MAIIDEETTICPEEHSKWSHNESKKDYKVLGPQKAKFNSDWRDGVAYESMEDGKRYWRQTRDFYRSFTKRPD